MNNKKTKIKAEEIEKAKLLLQEQAEQEKLTYEEAIFRIDVILKDYKLSLGTILTKQNWLELGKEFIEGKEQVILKTNLFKS